MMNKPADLLPLLYPLLPQSLKWAWVVPRSPSTPMWQRSLPCCLRVWPSTVTPLSEPHLMALLRNAPADELDGDARRLSHILPHFIARPTVTEASTMKAWAHYYYVTIDLHPTQMKKLHSNKYSQMSGELRALYEENAREDDIFKARNQYMMEFFKMTSYTCKSDGEIEYPKLDLLVKMIQQRSQKNSYRALVFMQYKEQGHDKL